MNKWDLIKSHTLSYFHWEKSDTLEWWHHVSVWYEDEKLQGSMLG